MRPKDCNYLSAAISIAALSASAVAAQTSPLIIDKGRIDRQQDQIAPKQTPEPLRGRLAIDESAPDESAANLTFVRIRGSSLSQIDLEQSWRKSVGRPLDRTAIEAVATALSAIYQKSDIALFTILAPSQDLSDGQLDLIVIEGHISDVVIQTDDKEAKDIELARDYAATLTTERPLRRQTLERYLSLIRDIPGEKVEAQFVPAAQRGGARLVLTARRNRMDFGFGLNNRGSPLLGQTQANLDASYNDLLRGGDQTTLSFSMPTHDDRFIYASLSHSTPIGADGMRVSLSASKLKTRLDSGIDGDAETGGVSVSYPLIRGYQKNSSVSFGFDALESSNAAFGQALDSSSTRVIRSAISYGINEEKSALGVSASISHGLDIWGASVNPFLAQSDFTKAGFQAGFDRLFATRYALRLRTTAQFSDDMLPASEQFALGGESYGRAYGGAVIQGDAGMAGSIEAAVRFLKLLPDWMAGSETYVFADAGSVKLNERPLLFPDMDFSLSSAGVGARIAMGKKTTVGLEFAHGLEAPYAAVEGEWRVSYSLVSRH
ncbi:MAG: ShlB/FhaC/HecB family hemolysin secretion/activation protein [Caulobacterales bacterium]